MKKVNVLILDDNELVSTEIILKLHDLNKKQNSTGSIPEVCPFHLTISNVDPKKAAQDVHYFVLENKINFLLLDRSFSQIIDPKKTDHKKLDTDFLYKDNSKGGFYIENLLMEWSRINKSSLNSIKGIIIYTYDDFRDDGKKGDVVKKTISSKIENIISNKCALEIFLTFSDIYENSEIDLYVGFKEDGIIKMGKKKDFMLYGAFVGEIIYHRMIHMLNDRTQIHLKTKRIKLIYKVLILFPVFISINIGSSALYDFTKLHLSNALTIGVLSLFFAIILPLVVLLLKQSVLIDMDDT